METVTEWVEPWCVLSQMAVQSCPQCGEETRRFASYCETCGSFLERIEDAPPVDIVVGDTRGARPHKVPMEEAGNLARLTRARNGLAAGHLGPEDFAEIVDEVLYIVESGLELYASPVMKEQRAGMPAAATHIYARLAAAAQEMQRGLERMLSYLENMSLAEVDAGLAQVEAALWKVDAAQELALERRQS